jgi:hypothetical protein
MPLKVVPLTRKAVAPKVVDHQLKVVDQAPKVADQAPKVNG